LVDCSSCCGPFVPSSREHIMTGAIFCFLLDGAGRLC